MQRRQFLLKLGGIALVAPALKMVGAGCAGETTGGDPSPQRFMVTNSDGSGHTHTFWISCEEMGIDGNTYVAEGAHTHMVTLSGVDLDRVFAGETVTIETSGGHPHTWVISMPSALCGG